MDPGLLEHYQNNRALNDGIPRGFSLRKKPLRKRASGYIYLGSDPVSWFLEEIVE
jgi:hypothetical protein